MAPVREFGKRQHKPRPGTAPLGASEAGGEKSGAISTARLAVFGFLAAVAAVGGWTLLQGPERLTLLWAFVSTPELRSLLPFAGESGSRLDFSSDRIGRASTAPVLKLCVGALHFDNDAETEWEPAMILQMLEAGNTQAVGRRVLGKPNKSAELSSAQHWGVMADCVYRQDATRLCDIDNRALAVKAAITFVREADRIVSEAEATSYEVQNMRSTRDRVLEALGHRVRSGILIAADFSFAPSAIRDVLRSTETLQNDCAKK